MKNESDYIKRYGHKQTYLRSSEEIQKPIESPRTTDAYEMKVFEPEKVYHITHENLYLREKQVLTFLESVVNKTKLHD